MSINYNVNILRHLMQFTPLVVRIYTNTALNLKSADKFAFEVPLPPLSLINEQRKGMNYALRQCQKINQPPP